MTPELYWLTLCAIATGLMWAPHIMQLIVQEGFLTAFHDPHRETPHNSVWARRARRAHSNSVENLVVFTPLALLIFILDASTPHTQMACAVFFFARLSHFIAYVFAIPYVRVLSFCIGWFCQMTLGLLLLGVL